MPEISKYFNMDDSIIKWLLESDPWTEYRTRIDILGQAVDDSDVTSARNRMTSHPQVVSLLNELKNWPGVVLSSHKSAGQLYHKLSFLADLGFSQNDAGIQVIIDKILEHVSEEGPLQLPMNIPVHFGGSGQVQYAWALCDAPILVYCLSKFGLATDNKISKAKLYLLNLCRENGYPCAASKVLGKFRGPGRKDDPCPYATMIMLKLMSVADADKNSRYAERSIDTLLNLWEHSKTNHPYMFYMGTDFRKLKAPLIWYDILHVADILSNFTYAITDERFIKIVSLIETKANKQGQFIPESEWKAWKGWDFGQKKLPSSWLTFLVYRIIKRMRK